MVSPTTPQSPRNLRIDCGESRELTRETDAHSLSPPSCCQPQMEIQMHIPSSQCTNQQHQGEDSQSLEQLPVNVGATNVEKLLHSNEATPTATNHHTQPISETRLETHEILPQPVESLRIPTLSLQNSSLTLLAASELDPHSQDLQTPVDTQHEPGNAATISSAALPVSEDTTSSRRPSQTPSTGTVASASSVTIMVDSATQRLICLKCNYEALKRQYFCTEMPQELEGVISQHDYRKRLVSLNKKLSRLLIGDYGPIQRTLLALFGCFSFTIPFLQLGSSSMLIYWISVCFGMTSFVYAIPRTFVRSKAETFVQTQVQDFSKQDASICLVWNSTRTVRAATFGFDFRRKAAHVPWVISIKYVPRGRRVAARLQGSAAGERETERDEDGGGNDWDSWDGEQLPRYTPLLLLSDHGRGRRSDMGLVETRSVRNLPSYSTLPG